MGCSPVGQASRSSQHGSVMLCDPLAALESTPHTGRMILLLFRIPGNTKRLLQDLEVILLLSLPCLWQTKSVSLGREQDRWGWSGGFNPHGAGAGVLGFAVLVIYSSRLQLDQHPVWWTSTHVLSDVKLFYYLPGTNLMLIFNLVSRIDVTTETVV